MQMLTIVYNMYLPFRDEMYLCNGTVTPRIA